MYVTTPSAESRPGSACSGAPHRRWADERRPGPRPSWGVRQRWLWRWGLRDVQSRVLHPAVSKQDVRASTENLRLLCETGPEARPHAVPERRERGSGGVRWRWCVPDRRAEGHAQLPHASEGAVQERSKRLSGTWRRLSRLLPAGLQRELQSEFRRDRRLWHVPPHGATVRQGGPLSAGLRCHRADQVRDFGLGMLRRERRRGLCRRVWRNRRPGRTGRAPLRRTVARWPMSH